MKNLKRIFSLALVGTMLAGMLTIGASAADFNDADDINNVEAVDTMVALNIINGKDDGSFDPDATVTRAEMAKMITIMLNGGSEPALTANANNAKFTDIGGHWAQKYIEYCVSQGVINGKGDGTFAPDATVTGTEAAKMALTALGYNSEVFNFTGIDWEINVNAAANAPAANLYEGLRTVDPSKGLSRDNAAQMLYNALDANVVEITYNITSNGVETGYVISDDKTMMTEKFGATKVEGVVVANEIAAIEGSTVKEGKTVIKNNTEDKTDKFYGTVTVKTSTDLDLIGRTVSVYVKSSSKKTDADIIGNVVLSDSNNVYTNADGEVFNDIEDGVETDKNTKYFNNYDVISGTAPTEGTAGITTILVDNDNDDVVEYVFLVKYTVAQVAKINTKDETIRFNGGLNTVDYKDMFGYEDLEVDDIVLSTKIGNKYYLEIPETVEGEIEEYKGNGKTDTDYVATKLTVDGTTYDVADVDNTVADLVAANTMDKDNLGDQGIFYLDGNGMIVAYAETEATAAQYAISWGGASGNKIDNNRIKLTLEDGTTAIYTIDSKSDLKMGNSADGSKFDDNKNAVGVLVAYTIKSNGNVTLSYPANVGTPVAGDINDKTTEFEQGKTLIGSNAATSRTVFFFVETNRNTDGDIDSVDSVEIYTGYKNAPTVKEFEANEDGDAAAKDTGISLALDKKNDKILAAAFVDAKTGADDAKLANHLWVKSLGTTNNDYTNANVVLEDGTETSIKVEGDVNANTLYLYAINSDGYYELELPTKNNASSYKTGDVYSVNSDTVIVTLTGGTKAEYYMTDDTVDYVASKKFDLEENAPVELLVNDDDEVLMIVVNKTKD